MKSQKLALAAIRLDGGTQSRAELSDDAIADYAAAYVARAPMPPVVAFLDAAGVYWLADGFHRCAGALRARQKTIAADVRVGEQRDAVLYSVGANVAHGLRRTNADKRRAVEILLRDSEWSARSDRWVAETAGVHHETVAALRGELAISPVDGRGGQDGKTRKLPQKAEAGGATEGFAEAPANAVREAHGTPDVEGGGANDRPASSPSTPGAQPGDVEHDDGANTRPSPAEHSASPANVPPPIDMHGLSATPEWLAKVRALAANLEWDLGIARDLKTAIGRIDTTAIHSTHLALIKLAVAEAIRMIEQCMPTSACRRCLDPDGSDGRRDDCGVCLGHGYIVASQEAGAVAATKRKPAKAPTLSQVARTVAVNADGSFERDEAGAVVTVPVDRPAKRPPPRNRIVLVREDGAEQPFIADEGPADVD